MDKKVNYKVTNAGSQKITAPIATKAAPKGAVIKGKDLRTKKSK